MRIAFYLFTLAAFLFSGMAQAQEGKYDKLMLLYLDEDYEKLLRKAEKYTDDSDTRRDPQPYLFMAKAYYEMSKREEYKDEIEPDDAIRSAFRYASRYRSKDEEGKYYEENEIFFQEMKQLAVEQAENEILQDDWRKARRYYDEICEFDPNDPGAWMMQGYAYLQGRGTREADRQLEKGYRIAKERNLDDLWRVEKGLLKKALINYSEHLVEKGMRDSARKVIEIGNPVFMEDKEFEVVYNEIK